MNSSSIFVYFSLAFSSVFFVFFFGFQILPRSSYFFIFLPRSSYFFTFPSSIFVFFVGIILNDSYLDLFKFFHDLRIFRFFFHDLRENVTSKKYIKIFKNILYPYVDNILPNSSSILVFLILNLAFPSSFRNFHRIDKNFKKV